MFLKKIVIFCFMLIALSAYSQNDLTKKSSVNLPNSIYASISYDNFSFYKRSITEDLKLTGYKFMIVSHDELRNIFMADLRNLNREISFEDLQDNYKKKELTKHFFTGYDLRYIPWRTN